MVVLPRAIPVVAIIFLMSKLNRKGWVDFPSCRCCSQALTGAARI